MAVIGIPRTWVLFPFVACVHVNDTVCQHRRVITSRSPRHRSNYWYNRIMTRKGLYAITSEWLTKREKVSRTWLLGWKGCAGQKEPRKEKEECRMPDSICGICKLRMGMCRAWTMGVRTSRYNYSYYYLWSSSWQRACGGYSVTGSCCHYCRCTRYHHCMLLNCRNLHVYAVHGSCLCFGRTSRFMHVPRHAVYVMSLKVIVQCLCTMCCVTLWGNMLASLPYTCLWRSLCSVCVQCVVFLCEATCWLLCCTHVHESVSLWCFVFLQGLNIFARPRRPYPYAQSGCTSQWVAV